MIARFYCHRVSKSTNVFFWKISNLARNQIRLRNTMIIEIEQIDSIYVKSNNLIDRTFVWQRIGRVNLFVIERKAKKKKKIHCEREKGEDVEREERCIDGSTRQRKELFLPYESRLQIIQQLDRKSRQTRLETRDHSINRENTCLLH